MLRKYILTVLCSVQYLESMDNLPIKILIWDSECYAHGYGYCPHSIAVLDLIQEHSFTNSTVLAYDDTEAITKKIAQSALVVHVDSTPLIDPQGTEQYYRHSLVKNVIFTKPQQNKYDYIVMYNPQELKKEIIRKNLRTCYPLLKSSGRLLSLVRLKTDNCILQTALDQLYPKIYAVTSIKKRRQLNLVPPQNFNSFNVNLFSFDELADTCTMKNLFSHDELANNNLSLFDIESHQAKTYNIVIKDYDMYQDWLELIFDSSTQDCELPGETMKVLQEQYVALVLQQLKRNNEGDLIHPFNITELVLRKWIVPMHRQKKGSWPLERSKRYEK